MVNNENTYNSLEDIQTRREALAKEIDASEDKIADLWQTLDALLQTHKVQFVWVKGHADNVYNNRCDALAVAQREKFA